VLLTKIILNSQLFELVNPLKHLVKQVNPVADTEDILDLFQIQPLDSQPALVFQVLELLELHLLPMNQLLEEGIAEDHYQIPELVQVVNYTFL
jgi:hypothetical protein